MLNVGDRIWLSGGYDIEPTWLKVVVGYPATILGFFEYDFDKFTIAQLDQKIKSNRLESNIILMELRYQNAVWE